MKAIKLGMPIMMIIISGSFLIASLNIPKATLGNPNGPLYFPVGVSVLMLILSIVYLIKELKALAEENEDIKELFEGRTLKLIGVTVILGIIYAFIFEKLGYFTSTLIFLGALLFYVNGYKKWLVNTVVTIVFTFMTWYGFSVLLSVSLP